MHKQFAHDSADYEGNLISLFVPVYIPQSIPPAEEFAPRALSTVWRHDQDVSFHYVDKARQLSGQHCLNQTCIQPTESTIHDEIFHILEAVSFYYCLDIWQSFQFIFKKHILQSWFYIQKWHRYLKIFLSAWATLPDIGISNQTTQLFVQKRTMTKVKSKLYITGPLWWESTGYWWFPLTNSG